MLLGTGTVYLGSEDNLLEIKACAKDVCKMHKKIPKNEALVLLKKT